MTPGGDRRLRGAPRPPGVFIPHSVGKQLEHKQRSGRRLADIQIKQDTRRTEEQQETRRRRCSLRTIGLMIFFGFFSHQLGDQATDGRKLRSLVANQRGDGVSYSAGREKKKSWEHFLLFPQHKMIVHGWNRRSNWRRVERKS